MTNKMTSLYFDTSVFGGYYDDIFMQDTRLLFQKIKNGRYNVVISNLTEKELLGAPDSVKKLLDDMEYIVIEVTPDCVELAEEYIKEKVVGKTNKDDCIHIATATVNNVDYLVSWNFKHIVHVERIRGYNSINIKNGYKQLEIRSPREMGLYDD